MIPLINIHYHHLPRPSHEEGIFSHTQLEDPYPSHGEGPLSVGLHPWFLPSSWKRGKEILDQWISHPQVCALGEIGLDQGERGLQRASLKKQKFFFKKQIEYFLRCPQRLLFIHCVKAYHEIIPALKELSSHNKVVIFHDFNSSHEEFKKIIHIPFFYFSLGQNFLRPQSRLHRFLHEIPIDRIFFETDDKEISLCLLYEKFAKARSLEINKLKRDIYRNYLQLFPKKNLRSLP